MSQQLIDSIRNLAYKHGFNAYPDMSMTAVIIQITDSKNRIHNFRTSSYGEALAVLGY